MYSVMTAPVLGYFLWTLINGDSEQKAKEFNAKDETSTERKMLIMKTLQSKGASDLSRLRDETTKKRQAIAEASTKYNIPAENEASKSKDEKK